MPVNLPSVGIKNQSLLKTLYQKEYRDEIPYRIPEKKDGVREKLNQSLIRKYACLLQSILAKQWPAFAAFLFTNCISSAREKLKLSSHGKHKICSADLFWA